MKKVNICFFIKPKFVDQFLTPASSQISMPISDVLIRITFCRIIFRNHILKEFLKKKIVFLWGFHPILVTSFLVVLGGKITKILHNSLFIFHFVLPILPCKHKTLYRKSHNLSDKKSKTKLPKYVMSRH